MPKTVKLDMKVGEYGPEFGNVISAATARFGGHRFDAASFDKYMQWYPKELQRIRGDEAYLTTVCRMDAGEAAFFARQLEYVKQRTYDIKFPEGSITTWLTVNSEAGPGAESILWRQYNTVGKMGLVGDNVKDLPRVESYGKEQSVAIKSFGSVYGYTLQEIRNAMYAGVPLQTRKANAARRTYDQTLNDVGWNANGTAKWGGVRGLLYAQSVINSATDSIGLFGNWCDENGGAANATPDQIVSDITTIANKVRIGSKNVERVNTVIFPLAVEAYLKNTRVSSVSDTTIMKFVKDNFPEITFGAVNELANVNPKPSGAGTTDVVLAFNNSPDNITYDVPQPFEQLPVEVRGFEYTIVCHCRIAGVNVYYPKSVFVAEGIIKRS